MLLLSFDVDDRRAQEYFDYAGYHTRRMTPVFREIANLVHDYLEAQFDTEGEALSGGWAPLAPATVEDRGSANPILDDTGVLRGIVLERPGLGGRFGVGGLTYGNGYLRLAPHAERNGVDLVDVHSHGRDSLGVNQEGKDYGGMPARPIWEMPLGFSAEVGLIAYQWLRELKSHNARRRGLNLMRPSDLEPEFSFDG